MQVKGIGFLLLAILLPGKASSQDVDIGVIDQLTAKAMKHLTTNTRFAFTAKMYDEIELGKDIGSESTSGYFGETTGVFRIHTVIKVGNPSESKLGFWVNHQRQITTEETKTGFVIVRQEAPWVSQLYADAYANFRSNIGLGHFVFPASANRYCHSLNPDSFPYVEQKGVTTTVAETKYKDRPCYQVKVVTTYDSPALRPIIAEYFLDKQYGMILAQKQNGVYQVVGRTPVILDVNQLTEVSYGPPAEDGLPFPTAVKGSYTWQTGRRETMTDVQFSEFKRYTPTAEELDFAKQFGIPLPELPPKPEILAQVGYSQFTRWLVGGLSLTLLAFIVGYFLFRKPRG